MSDGLKLLGSIIDTGSINVLRDLEEDLFIEEEREVFRFLRSHYRRYGQVPAIETVEEELDVAIPEASEVPAYYVKRVHDRKLYGVVRGKFEDLKDCLRRFDMDSAREVIDELRSSTRIIHTASDIRNIAEAYDGAMALYDHAHRNPGVSGVPSGWPRFDYATGGYQPGDLVSYVARPGMGKTFLMLKQSLASWRAGFSTLVVTMEMTTEQCARRALALETGINPDYLRKGMLSTHAMRRLRAYRDNIVGSGRFHIFSGGMKSKVSDVDMLVSEYQPDILYVDGVYLMRPESTRNMSKLERIPEVFDELKSMTLSQNIPVVCTTQFSRQAGKKGKEGSLENIAYTDAISTHSSLVIGISDADPPHGSSRKRLTFLKGREGEAGVFDINYKFSPIDMSEVEVETDEEGNPVTVPTTAGVSTDWMASD